jgi:autotransporter-associated beta strand protein
MNAMKTLSRAFVFSCVAVLNCALAALSVGAAEYTLKSSVHNTPFDWRAGSNYEEGTAPSAGDYVKIPKDVNAILSHGDEWWDFVSALGRIRPTTATSYFTVSIPAGVTNTLACEITNSGANDSAGMDKGFLVKIGQGVLDLTLDKSGYFTRITVEEGGMVLRLSLTKCYADALTVREGAFVDLCSGNTLQLHHFYGEGEITSSDNSALQTFASDSSRSDFSGSLSGNLKFNPASRVMLRGMESGFTGSVSLYGKPNEMKEAGAVLGVMKIGNKSDEYSSVGTADTFYFGNGGSESAGLLYLGSGETSNKDFAFRTFNKSSFSFIDGGAVGGLTLTGTLSTDKDNAALNHRFGLCGSNVTDCVLGMTISDRTDTNGNPVSYHIVKRGSGTWKLAPKSSSTWAGALSVEEGTIKYDTIADAGSFCALGYATNLFDCYTRKFEESIPVDWAIALGAADGTEGTLEYTGTKGVVCATRPIVLKGDGRIRQNVQKPFRFDGVSSAGDNAKSLVLDGSGTGGNEISGISDVGHGAISVVKEGTGTWTLSAANSFRGALTVKEGVLNVCAPNWNWLKFVVRQNFTNETGKTSAPGFYTREMAFFNKDGVSQTIGTTFNYSSDGLLPGHFTFNDDTYEEQKTTSYPNACWSALFDDSNNPTKIGFAKLTPVENKETSWASIVIRLPENADPVTSVDYVWVLANNKSGCNTQPSWFTVMGSFDGFEWNELFSTNYAYASSHGKWVSSDAGYNPGDLTAAKTNANKRRHGMPLAQPGDSVRDPIDSVSCVSVSSGATLKCLYGVITLDSFGIDMTSGGGTVEGFAFAETGTLQLSNVDTDSDLTQWENTFIPVNCTGVTNLSGWSFTVNGSDSSKYSVSVTENGMIRLVTLGLRVIIR